MMHFRLFSLFLSLVLGAFNALGQPSLNSISFNDPAFKERFLGSYGFDGPREPSVTPEEQGVLQSIYPLMQNGQVVEAARRLQNATKPNSSAALDYTLANLYLQNGDTNSAENAYRAALAKQPGFVRAWRNLGLMLAQSGRNDEAMLALQQAIERGDQTAATRGTLAFCHYQNDDYAAALEGYEEAVFLDANSADWQLGRAQCLIELDRAEEALSSVEQYLKSHPGHVEARRVAANACVALNDWERVVAHLETLRRSSRADDRVLLQLGRAYLVLELPRLATAAFTDSIRSPRKPQVEELLDAANLLAGRNYSSEAEALLEVILQHYSESIQGKPLVQLLLLRARLKMNQADPKAAAEILEEVIRLDALNVDALLLLADAERRQGNLEKAEVLLERTIDVDETSADAWLEIARVYVDQNRWTQAITALQRSQALRPDERVERYLKSLIRVAEQQ
ncbi:MAG: tetratricopeptide repeat protein [Verrucomicrobiota bacterium]